MSLYDVGASTDDPGAMRLEAAMYERRGDKRKAASLRHEADVYEGKAPRLQATKERIAGRRTSVPTGVVVAGLAIVGGGIILGSRRRA